jgi:hypothetical protein
MLFSIGEDIWDEFCATVPAPIRIGLIVFAAVLALVFAFAPLPGAQMMRTNLGLADASQEPQTFLDSANYARQQKARMEQRASRGS